MRLALVLCLAATAAQADDAALNGPAISAALTGRALIYDDGSRQGFQEGGATTYESGRPSLGRWAVRGDQYCSVWPPSDQWACYGVRQSDDGRTVTFVAGDGSLSVGHFVP